MWGVKLQCIQPECTKAKSLTAWGLYKTVRRVLDIDGLYHMDTEYLECPRCHKKYAAWNGVILKQLKSLTLTKDRGLGNSSTHLQKKLAELHVDSDRVVSENLTDHYLNLELE